MSLSMAASVHWEIATGFDRMTPGDTLFTES